MSSTTESTFDIEMFIHAIQERPVIWDISLNVYSNRILKRKAWEEVCNQFIHDFSTKTSKQKSEEALQLQKKWKSIRDAYTRSKNKKVKSGSGACTSRDYIYSDILSFLNPLSETRPPPSLITEDTSQCHTTPMQSNRRKRQARDDINERDDAFIDILAERMAKSKEESNQPDRLFLMSLVEDFGSIHPDYKMDARVEIFLLSHPFCNQEIAKKFQQMSRSSVQNNQWQNSNPGYYTATGWQLSSSSTHIQSSNRDYMPPNFHSQHPSQNVAIPPQPSPSEHSGEASQNSSQLFDDLYD